MSCKKYVVPRVIKEKIPHQTAEFARCLCIRQPRPVFDKLFDLFRYLADETSEIARLRGSVRIDLRK